MVVIDNPTVWEISEMLDFVAAKTPLDEVRPKAPEGMTRAEVMYNGITFLFFSERTYLPLGFVVLDYSVGHAQPFLSFATTNFATPADIFCASKAVMRYLRGQKRGAKLYITNERVARFALANGFHKIKGNIYGLRSRHPRI